MLPLPGLLAEAAGVVVSEYDAIGNSVHRIRNAEGQTFAAKQWCDLLELRGAEPIAWYDNDFYEGVRQLLSISLVKVKCIMSALGRSHRISISCSKGY